MHNFQFSFLFVDSASAGDMYDPTVPTAEADNFAPGKAETNIGKKKDRTGKI